MSVDQLIKDYKKLTPDEQSRFHSIIEAREEECSLTPAQSMELDRREKLIESGEMPTYTHEEVMAHIAEKHGFSS